VVVMLVVVMVVSAVETRKELPQKLAPKVTYFVTQIKHGVAPYVATSSFVSFATIGGKSIFS
jgi:hypothetical protein